ncbi:hypothetical protein C1645_837519, partial [Glomus cerebriforme]
MDLVNTKNEYSFDPTPKLKSNPIPLTFVSFNRVDDKCFYCGEEYFYNINYGQSYCKKCLSRYISETTDIKSYLDVYIENLKYDKYELRFRQIPYNAYFYEVDSCKLCGKLFCKCTKEFILCSDCYRISFEWIESTLTKKLIPIIYLPWWNNHDKCRVCSSKLKFTSDCQKYCKYCHIFYTGCRYCLTTNVIFGLTDQSQCKKCRRVTSIDITNISSGNSDLDDFLFNTTS